MLRVPTPPAAAARTPDNDQLMSVTTMRDGVPGQVVVEVVGEVDSYTAPALEACLRSQSRQHGVRELVVDLAGVRFLGAAGVRVLARTGHRCRVRGARLVVLTRGRRASLRPLQLTGLTDREAVDPPGDDRSRRPRAKVGV